jgi:protein-L-isoaspartate(D-aspartate) O-methyltransferase
VSEFETARKQMVDCQIRPSDVTDRRLIAAFLDIPRHLFVPRARRASAYSDGQVQVGDARMLMRPRDFAKLVHAADIQPHELVLDIACARGYSTAILARMREQSSVLNPMRTACHGPPACCRMSARTMPS